LAALAARSRRITLDWQTLRILDMSSADVSTTHPE
jgi:hypothetical protein